MEAADCTQTSLLAPAINFSVLKIDNVTCSITSLGFLPVKFWLVAVFGSICSFVGVVQNSLLAYLFISREKFRNSNLFFLGFAAVFDILLDAMYPPLMSISVLFEYYESTKLLYLWHAYVLSFNAISHVSMTASTFLLCAATYERFRLTMHWRFQSYGIGSRLLIVAVLLLLALALQAPIFFEIVVNYIPECEEFHPLGVYMLSHSCLSKVEQYVIYKFWIRKSFSKVVPFLLLFGFNMSIIFSLRGGKKSSMLDMRNAMLTIAYGERTLDKHRKQVHRATRTMVLVTFAYLGTHLLDFVVSSWELIDIESIKQTYFMFYTISADLISILAVLGNVLRLPIYCTSDKEIRKALYQLFRNLWGKCSPSGGIPPEQLQCHCNENANGTNLLLYSNMSESLEIIHQIKPTAMPRVLSGRKNRRLSHIYG